MPEGKPGGGHLGGGVRGWLRAFAWKDAKPKEKRQANQSLGVELWWRNTEPNPRPHMRFFRKALILRVLASIKWPFCIVGTPCWASLPLQ